jgi:hypothetical protein
MTVQYIRVRSTESTQNILKVCENLAEEKDRSLRTRLHAHFVVQYVTTRNYHISDIIYSAIWRMAGFYSLSKTLTATKMTMMVIKFAYNLRPVGIVGIV